MGPAHSISTNDFSTFDKNVNAFLDLAPVEYQKKNARRFIMELITNCSFYLRLGHPEMLSENFEEATIKTTEVFSKTISQNPPLLDMEIDLKLKEECTIVLHPDTGNTTSPAAFLVPTQFAMKILLRDFERPTRVKNISRPEPAICIEFTPPLNISPCDSETNELSDELKTMVYNERDFRRFPHYDPQNMRMYNFVLDRR